MAIAEAIGTAIGEVIGIVQKMVTDMSVESVLELITGDNTDGRKKKLSYVDNVNQAKKALYETRMGMRTQPVDESCLKIQKNMRVNQDGISESDAVRRAIMTYVIEPGEESLRTLVRWDEMRRTGDSQLPRDSEIDGVDNFEKAKAEINATLGTQYDPSLCFGKVGDETRACEAGLPRSPTSTLVSDQSRKLVKHARIQLVKAILADDVASRFHKGSVESRMELIKAQIESLSEGGPLMQEMNAGTGDETPILKELVANQMTTNQLYIEMIFEEERRLALAAVDALLEVEHSEQA